jgi:hypothetical protein
MDVSKKHIVIFPLSVATDGFWINDRIFGYDLQSVGQSRLEVRRPSGTRDQFFFLLENFFRQLR